MVNKIRRRISRTIPFGYKVKGKNKILYPVSSQLNALKVAKEKIIKGNMTLREGAIFIKKKSGRSLSHIALNMIITKELPNWSKTLRKKEKKERAEKKRLLEIQKAEIKKKREIEKTTKLSSQNRINKRCITCNKIKILEDFQQLNKYKASYCRDCYQLILMKSSKIIVKCTYCKKNKNLNELRHENGITAFTRKICTPCDKKRTDQWRKNNPEKIRRYKYKERLRSISDIKKESSLW